MPCHACNHRQNLGMESAKQELEQAFLGLSDLKHVGMALMQFAVSLFGDQEIVKTETGGFSLRVLGRGFVEFSFPDGRGRTQTQVDLDSSKMEGLDGRHLPVSDGCPFPVCEIKRLNQLAIAARYIEAAHGKYLGTRLTSSDGFDRTVN